MATILCIETATTNCSVALSVHGSVIALVEDNSKQFSHAERLHVFIDQVLTEAGIDKGGLDAIAVSKGPGSYTGLRIGVSAAKGLCFALDIPLISIATLKSLALQVKSGDGKVVSMLDARRMEVYSAVFTFEGDEVRETQAEILTEHSFSDFLEESTVFFIGSGVEKFEAYCTHKNAVFVKDRLPSAREMCALADLKYKISDIENVAYFEPYYLKDFISTTSSK
jgi:tRNA threonylcarbamoyladenosine biosynthesis protein TsaB